MSAPATFALGAGMTTTRKWLIGSVALAAVAGFGCNPFIAPYFLLFGAYEKVPAEYPIATALKETKTGRVPRVAIIAYTAPEVSSDFVGVERSLSQQLGTFLKRLCTTNKEKIEFVPAHEVEKFKNTRPNWRSMKGDQLAKALDCDGVIDLEIAQMTLYEPDSHKQLYRGRCHITVTVLDPKHADDGPVFRHEYTCIYPNGRGSIPVDRDTNAEQFKQQFLAYVVTDLMWLFSEHLKEESLHRPD